MRVTIIRDDNTVAVDGETLTVDCSTLPADFHALQWSGFAGEVEYNMTRCDHCGARTKKGNVFISDVSPFKSFLDAWGVAKAAAVAAAEAFRVAQEEAKAAAVLAAGGANAAGPQG